MKRLALAMAVCAACVLVCSAATTRTLTNNGYDDLSPRIHGGQVVWYGWDGNDYEIYLYRDGNVTALTDNAYDDKDPVIHAGLVAWYGYDGNDNEVYLYDGATTVPLTDNDYDDRDPDIDSGQVVWRGWKTNDWEIFLYRYGGTEQLTDDETDDVDPCIHQGLVAWVRDCGSANNIFIFDGASSRRLTDPTSTGQRSPSVHSDHIAFLWGPNVKLYTSDGNGLWSDTGRKPVTHGGQMVYAHESSGDNEIRLYDGVSFHTLTHNDYDDVNPDVFAGKVVWQGKDGPDYEIFFRWDNRTHKVTHNQTDDINPRICGNTVVWQAFDGNDYEIRMYTLSLGPWADAIDMGGGWQCVPWFGGFLDMDGPWINHLQHDLMYCLSDSPDSIWLWTPDMGWLWTSHTRYPYMLRSGDVNWLWYSWGSDNPRLFYNATTHTWEYW